MLSAGRLRHRITIQGQVQTQDSTTGEIKITWRDIGAGVNVPAAVEPLSVRDTLAAQTFNSKVTARMTIRYRDDVDHSNRIIYRNKVYKPEGFLEDSVNGLTYLTIPVSQGVNKVGE